MKIGFLSHLDLNLYAFRLPVMLELKRIGHTPIAIAPEGQYLQMIRDAGIEVVPYAIERKSLNPMKELKAIQNIYEAIKPLELDILHTFTAKPNIYGTIAGRLAKVPRIINLVEGLGSFYLENDLKSRTVRSLIETLYKRIFKLSNAVMFVNSDDPEYLASKGIINSAKIRKINGVGIDTAEWKRKNEAKEPLAVIMIARLIRHKGVVEYLEACQNLKSKYPDVRFVYVGGEDMGNPSGLKKEIFDSFEGVEYLGERSDIKELLENSHIFVLPSYREGLPRTVLEAMSMEVAVVGADACGTRDVVRDGKTGLLAPVKDTKALEAAIEKLITDGDLRKKLAKAGRETCVKEYDIKPIAREHLRIYGLI
ncbi:MAG: glycosyltransferase family 4 protein [Campylobacterales bacterium]|nr:glycosyltransferase family 4 protein [Campylobacterales bacterium]